MAASEAGGESDVRASVEMHGDYLMNDLDDQRSRNITKNNKLLLCLKQTLGGHDLSRN